MDGFEGYDSDSDVLRHLNFSDPEPPPYNLSPPPSSSLPPGEHGSASYEHVGNALPNLIPNEPGIFPLEPPSQPPYQLPPLPFHDQRSTNYNQVGNASQRHISPELDIYPSDLPPLPPYQLPPRHFQEQRSTNYNQIGNVSQHLISSELDIYPSDPPPLRPYQLPPPPFHDQRSTNYNRIGNASQQLASSELDIFPSDPPPLPPYQFPPPSFHDQRSTNYNRIGNASQQLASSRLDIFPSDPRPLPPYQLRPPPFHDQRSTNYNQVSNASQQLASSGLDIFPSDSPPLPPYQLPPPPFHDQRSTNYNQGDGVSQHHPFHQPTSPPQNDEVYDTNDTDGDVQRHLLGETEPPSFVPHPPQPPPIHEDLLAEEPLVHQVDRDVSTDPDYLRSMIFALSGAGAENDGSGASSSNPPADSIDQPAFVPFVPSELDCTNCLPVREVTYTNGAESVKFVIHRRLGTFSHLIFYTQNTMEGVDPDYRQFMLDVSTQNRQWVKDFISQYQTQMINDGYAVFTTAMAGSSVEAPYGGASTSSNAVAVGPAVTVGPSQVPEYSSAGESSSISRGSTIGSDYDDEQALETTSPEYSTLPMATPSSVGTSQQSIEISHPTTGGSGSGSAPNRSRPMSIQRTRVKNMTLADVREYFHLPITAAAQVLDVCTSAIKNVCRRNGMSRWPQRQIVGIDKKIEKLRGRLRTGKFPQRAEKIEEEIASLLAKKARIYEGGTGKQ